MNYFYDTLGINQSTLSGAIDIIVIKHEPGSKPKRYTDNKHDDES